MADQYDTPVDEDPRLIEIRTVNMAKIKRLQMTGVQVNFGSLRFETLIDGIFPEREDRVRFELTVEQRVAHILDEVDREAAKAKLMQGVQGAQIPQGLIRP